MNSEQIRENFISFFKNKEHLYVNPSSLVIKNDPTLMFVNAGMNQFKDIFSHNYTISHQNCNLTQSRQL